MRRYVSRSNKPGNVIGGTGVQDCHRLGSGKQAEVQRRRFDIKLVDAKLTVNPEKE
jgi:hypothetical protein